MFARVLKAGTSLPRVAAIAGLLAVAPGSFALAQSAGPFSPAAGNWTGNGSVAFNDGRRERIRCRAGYQISNAGSTAQISISCASDSYKFELVSNVTAQAGQISGTWDERTRNVGGNVTGTINGGQVEVRAGGQTFNALLSIAMHATSQSITIRSPGSELSEVTIALNKAK